MIQLKVRGTPIKFKAIVLTFHHLVSKAQHSLVKSCSKYLKTTKGQSYQDDIQNEILYILDPRKEN